MYDQEKESRALRLLQYNQQREQAALEYQMKAAGLKVRAATQHVTAVLLWGCAKVVHRDAAGTVVASPMPNSCCATAAAGWPVSRAAHAAAPGDSLHAIIAWQQLWS